MMEASVATPAQGAETQGSIQSGAPDQGQQGTQATGAGKGSFNWGLFPTVPEDQRGALEPHLGNVLRHVTQMEGQMAPYRGFMESVGPDEIAPLLEFLTGWSQNPLETWLGLAGSMVNDGVLGPHVTTEALQELLNGGAITGAEAGQDEMPAWARQIQQRLDQLDQGEQQRQLSQQETEQDAMLDSAKTSIREQLTQSGVSPELVSDEIIVAAIIANNGDIASTVAGITQMRDGFLKGFTQQKQGPKPSNGKAPEVPKPKSGGRRGDPFGGAKDAALQHLRQSMAAGEQE